MKHVPGDARAIPNRAKGTWLAVVRVPDVRVVSANHTTEAAALRAARQALK